MWQVKLKHVLAEINKHYVLGCIDYYSKQDSDPWQEEQDRLEAIMKIGSEIEIKNALDKFETNCKLLILRFQK